MSLRQCLLSSPARTTGRLALLVLLVYGLLAGGPQIVRAAWYANPADGEAKEQAGTKTAWEESASVLVRSREHRKLSSTRRAYRHSMVAAPGPARHGHIPGGSKKPYRPDIECRNGIGAPLRC